jgi:protein SMG6
VVNNVQTKIRENIKAAIDISHQEYRAIQLEIRPIYLVPDTNCFIDHLFGIQRLLALRKFTIIVPLVGELICNLSDN